MFGGAAAQLVSRLRVVGAPLFARRVTVSGAVHVQRRSGQVRGSSSGARQSAGPPFGVLLGSSALDEDFGQSSLVVGGAAGGVVVVAVPAMNGGTVVVPGRGSLCGGRAPVFGLVSVEVLGGPFMQSQIQTGWLYPDGGPTLWRCVSSGNRRMRERFRRWHEGFADLADILSRYVESFSPFFLPNLPPVLVCFLDQHVAFSLADDDEAVLGLVFIVVLHLDVDIARSNRQLRHGAYDCQRGSSPREEDVY